MAENLTPLEKARLWAEIDHRNRDDYDKDYYNELRKIEEPSIGDLDGQIRRAILRYIQEVESHFFGEQHPRGSYLMEGWILGYLAGRNIKRSIFNKQHSEAER